jgi:NADH-quinone oxidoreductase subunit L
VVSDPGRLLALVPLLPLAGFLVNGLLGRRIGGRAAGAVATTASAAAFACAVGVARALLDAGAPVRADLATWFDIEDLQVRFAFVCDRLSMVMMLVVTGVGTLIHLYSTGYMSHDPSRPRYFAYLNLFMSAMLVLVLADNLLVMFVGWEGVGLCSYLLIGFWFEDPEKAAAGKKAFIVNRIGDLGFLLGLFGIFMVFHSLDFDVIHRMLDASKSRLLGPVPVLNITLVTAITMCLFVGATGKSAQIPLYVWLPDAMAGPTPVSALIHAATMVTAGVYMIARLSHLFVLAPATLAVIAGVGAATAVFAALMGLAQNDIKKVLAYSTVSQLGLMFLATGVGAFSAAVFHLFTHAFFKALLFLGAGSVIHAMGGEQDMRRMGALRSRLPATFATMLVATLAIAGIPPLAGFFSKDEILWKAWEGLFAGTDRAQGLVLGVLATLASAMTAFYMFRLMAMTFFGSARGSAEAHSHAHESPWTMTLPLAVLAVFSFAAGFLNVPEVLKGSARFATFLAPVLGSLHPAVHDHHASHGAEIAMMVVSVLVALGSGGAALWVYVRHPGLPAAFLQRSPALARIHAAVRDRFYVDEMYDRCVVRPVRFTALALWIFIDVLVIDMIVNVAGLAVELASEGFRRLQDGIVGSYAVWFLAGGMLLLGYFLYQASVVR